MLAANQTLTAAVSMGYWSSFRRMPLALQAYAVFAVIAATAWCIGFAMLLWWPAYAAQISPYGNVTSLSGYFVTLYIVFALPVRRPRWMAFSLTPLLSIVLGSGAFEMSRRLSDSTVAFTAQTTIPSLQYEPLRPVFTIVVPLFWILMLLSPEVWRWATARKMARSAQASLLDLFYLIFACSVCIALSLGLMNHVRGRLDAGAKMTTTANVLNASPKATPPKSIRP